MRKVDFMPMVQIDMVQEARELQELLKDNPEAVKQFKDFELSHITAEKIKQEQFSLKNIDFCKLGL